jgi:hypothetical protein
LARVTIATSVPLTDGEGEFRLQSAGASSMPSSIMPTVFFLDAVCLLVGEELGK